MKQNKLTETIIYGVGSVVFAAAFFFSIMYPEYGITQQFYPCETYQSEAEVPRKDALLPGRDGKYRLAYLEDVTCMAELRARRKKDEEDRIVYASYFYDCFRSRS